TATQSYTATLTVNTAQYATLSDLSLLDPASLADVYQSLRSLVITPIGGRFRPAFAVSRADLAAAVVQGARVPQYLPGQSSYPDVRDQTTMLFVESAQAAPSGPLFPSVAAGAAFQPDMQVDRLTAVIALVRAAG